MRCMMCGDEMVLTEAMPVEAGGVHGFENQTHHCPVCGGTERRFIFVGRKTAFVAGGAETATLGSAPHRIKVNAPRRANGADKTAVSQPSSIKFFAGAGKEKSSPALTASAGGVTETTALASEPPLAQAVKASNGRNATGQTWMRAVEKFRSYEADLHRRVEKAKRAEPTAEFCRFDEFWDSLARPPTGQKLGKLSAPAASLASLFDHYETQRS